MARNRDNQRGGKQTGVPVPQSSPGGEDEQGGGDLASFGGVDEKVVGDVPARTHNQLDRALMHLGFFIQELEALVADKSKVAGLMRRTAAKNKQQFDGPIEGWPPIKVIRQILCSVSDELSRHGTS
jgi:hypothetical protein